ncbi:MAG: hypothetical protein M3271_11910, partial [Actinomycetota bacterium]|nr:hypothetical protein [Actinomycetota bacterium]
MASKAADAITRLGEKGLSDLESGSIVVLPSISFPASELRKIVGIEHYEERMLFVLLLLERPALELTFVTSTTVDPAVVDYYLGFLADPDSARERLHLVALDDPEPRALSEKLLERPDAIERIAATVPDTSNAYILPFNVTPWEGQVARRLDIPLYGPAPERVPLVYKSGSRVLAIAAGVPVLQGTENVHSMEEALAAIEDLRKWQPGARAAVIKLNEGFSGQGNAIIELSSVRYPLHESPTVFCATEESWASFGPKIAEQGAIVEELVRDSQMVSPSAQIRITPAGVAELVSTHDQILGGPDDQVYLGCR